MRFKRLKFSGIIGALPTPADPEDELGPIAATRALVEYRAGTEGSSVRIAHIINPVAVAPESELGIAQPVTFESMRVAAEQASGSVQVELYTAQYPEDRAIVPPHFTMTPDLERSAADVGTFAVPRKLPLLGDILQRLGEAAPEADVYIYTNVDIGLVPSFYTAVAGLMGDHDAAVINRRTIPAELNSVDQLPLMYEEVGKRHPGHDCFVFNAALLRKIELGESVIGIPWFDAALLSNLDVHARRLRIYEDVHLTFHIGEDRTWRRAEFDDYRAHNRREVLRILGRWASQGHLERRSLTATTLRAAQAEEAGRPAASRPRRLARVLARRGRSVYDRALVPLKTKRMRR